MTSCFIFTICSAPPVSYAASRLPAQLSGRVALRLAFRTRPRKVSQSPNAARADNNARGVANDLNLPVEMGTHVTPLNMENLSQRDYRIISPRNIAAKDSRA